MAEIPLNIYYEPDRNKVNFMKIIYFLICVFICIETQALEVIAPFIPINAIKTAPASKASKENTPAKSGKEESFLPLYSQHWFGAYSLGFKIRQCSFGSSYLFYVF